MEDSYVCKSPRKIPDNELAFLAKHLGCPVSEIDQVKDSMRGDYLIEKCYSHKDLMLLEESGLVPLLTPDRKNLHKANLSAHIQ